MLFSYEHVRVCALCHCTAPANRVCDVCLSVAAVVSLASLGWGFLPMQNPPWGPHNYNMSQSSITMACNASGWFDIDVGAAFGITSYDWRYARLIISLFVQYLLCSRLLYDCDVATGGVLLSNR